RSRRGCTIRIVVQCVVESKKSVVAAKLQYVAKIWVIAKELEQPIHGSITVGPDWHGTPILVFACRRTPGFSILVHSHCHGSVDQILNRQHMKGSLFHADFSL